MIGYSIPAQLICADLEVLLNPQFGIQYPVFVISSPSVLSIATVNQFLRRLKENGSVEVFGSISPNAPFLDIDRAITVGITLRPQTVIAVGGGSVIDASKAIACSIHQVGLYKEYFNQTRNPPAREVKLIAVPTTAGTGAELSYGAILFDEANGIKSGLRGKNLQPDMVLLDFQLYLNAPPRLIAEVGFDCLTHAVETYISNVSTPIVRYQSIAAIRTVFQSLATAYRGDLHSMRSMAIASSLMGINLALSSTCLPHRIQYVIGPMTGSSHAQGLIALYRGWISMIAAHEHGPFADLCQELGLERNDFIDQINQLKIEIGIDYTLTDLGVHRGAVADIVAAVTGNLKNDPYFIDLKTIENIIESSL